MKRSLVIAALLPAALLSGCAGLLSGLLTPPAAPASSSAAPAPVSAVVISPATMMVVKKRYLDALTTYDTLLTATDAMVATKLVTRGSPAALKLHDILLTLKLTLQAAGKAVDAGDATNVGELLDQATASVGDLKAAIAAAKGGK